MGLFAHIGEVDMKSVPGVSGLHEPICEAIGLALDRRIEHLDRVRIILVREHGALRIEHKARRLHLLADGCRLNPMQRLGGSELAAKAPRNETELRIFRVGEYAD